MPLPENLRWKLLPAACLGQPDEPWQGHWNRLNTQGLNLPFMDAQAWCAALREFGRGDEQLLAGLTPKGTAVALLIVQPQGPLRWRTFQPAQMPLGPVVTQPGYGLIELLEHAVRKAGWGAMMLSATQLDPLQFGQVEASPLTRPTPYIPTAWLEIGNEGFEAYWAARGKNLRQNLRKQRNKLSADGIQTRLRVITEAADIPAVVERYGALESVGWKAQEGTAIHPTNAQGRFYTALLTEAAKSGEAYITEYEFNAQVVAINLGLMRNGTWVVLKTTYDESQPKALSPASLLREDELQAFHAQGPVQRIEYYGRVMEWHTKLTEQQRTLFHLTSWRWAWLRGWVERLKSLRNPAPRAPEEAPVSQTPAESA